MATKLGRNDLCHCGSGKKYKACHLAEDTAKGKQPFKVKLSKGEFVVSDVQVETHLERAEETRLPSWLLSVARFWAAQAELPGAGEYQTLSTVLFTAIAAEAIVNRLLEPKTPPKEWLGRKGLERQGSPEKWNALYTVVGLPPLDEAVDPLKSFSAVTTLRNDLVHFKHGPNLRISGISVPTEYKNRSLTTDLRGISPDNLPVVKEGGQMKEQLHPSRARGYFESMRALLNPVLDRYPEDEFGIVGQLREAMEEVPQVSAAPLELGNGAPIKLDEYEFFVPFGQERLAPLFEALSDIRRLASEADRRMGPMVKPRRYAAGLLRGALRAASSSAKASQSLCMHGLAEPGMSHVRNICEWSIRCGYVVAHREIAESLARRWFAFQRFSQLRYAMAALKSAEKDLGADDLERLRRRIASLERRCAALDTMLFFPGNSIWSKEPFFDPDNPRRSLNIHDMAEIADQGWLYCTVYTPANDAVHATPMAVAVQVAGADKDVAGTLIATHIALRHLLTVVDDFVGLGMKPQIAAKQNALDDLIRQLVREPA